jgi:hypothetical protein
VQYAKAACAAFAQGILGARLKREMKLTGRAAGEAAEAWVEAEMATRAAELPLFADYASDHASYPYDQCALRKAGYC